MKTRILMFGWEFPPYNSGGLGVACLGLTKALSGLGVDVIFVMPKKLDLKAPWTKLLFADAAEAGESENVRAFDSIITPYISEKGYLRDKSGLSGAAVYAGDLLSEVLRYANYGKKIAKEEQFDVIYAHDWLSFPAGVAAKRASGKPLIVHVHATEFDRSGGGSVNQPIYEIEREGLEAADVVIAVSEMTKRLIVERYGIPAEKVRVVYNGIDETTAPHGSGELSRLRALKRSGFKLVLFLGRVTLQKGPDYFLRAAKRVLERNPNVMFILSGSGDMELQMMDLAAQLGLGGHIFFTGFLRGHERDEVYRSADLFVMPSVSEPFGIAPLEAMRAGTPVLISRQSGVSEVVRHALKADFWDVDEMANQILSVVGYPGLREALAENAAREAEALTWSAAAQKVDGIVRELAHQV